MKKLFIILLILIGYNTLTSGQTISDVFMSVPEDIFYGLDVAQKELLITQSADTSAVDVNDNNLYDEIKRLDFSEDFISFRTSSAGVTQIKLLPLINDSKVICVVRTVCKNICDSEIHFYTTKWTPIENSKLFSKPGFDLFLKKNIDRNSEEFKNAISALDMLPVKYTLSANENSLIVEYDIKNYLSKNDFEQLEPYLENLSKKMIWDKTTFK